MPEKPEGEVNISRVCKAGMKKAGQKKPAFSNRWIWEYQALLHIR
jgi:hypothetical protein